MYICLCNALSDASIRQAVRDGASRPREVYVRCGCPAQCGGCTRTILEIIRDDAAARPGLPGN
jgi:bacterioferritin-associated ferredoxin